MYSEMSRPWKKIRLDLPKMPKPKDHLSNSRYLEVPSYRVSHPTAKRRESRYFDVDGLVRKRRTRYAVGDARQPDEADES